MEYTGVMHLSERYDVPERLALLYDLMNSLDRRRYVAAGVVHAGGDEIADLEGYRVWLARHGLAPDADGPAHMRALRLRSALRDWVGTKSAKRDRSAVAEAFVAAASEFPLIVMPASGGLELTPKAADPIGSVLAQLVGLAMSGELGRLKMCASEECGWIFFDRSKPGNRRWCSHDRCGNREKTRAYRRRNRS